MSKDGFEAKRWRIAGAAVVMQLCLGSVYAWSIFKIPMMTAHGWTETQTQGAFMIYVFMFAVSVALGGTLVDRLGPRIVGLTGGVLFGTGLILAGYANELQSISLLYLAYGVIAGLGGGFGYVTPITTLIRWFPDKRGLVMGLAVMGYGLGSFILGNIGPRLILWQGIASTFLFWGLFSLVFITVPVLFFRNPPEGWMSLPQEPGSVHRRTRSYSFREAAATPQLWMLWMILFILVTAGLGLISQLSPMAQDVLISNIVGHMTEEKMQAIAIASGSIVAVAGVFNGVGRLLWAWVSDALGRRQVFAALFLTQSACFLLLAHTSHSVVFAVLVCYLLACYGGGLACMPAFAADVFGNNHIGKIYGVIFSANAVAGILGPYLFARIKQVTQGFALAFTIEAAILGVGFLLALMFRMPQPGGKASGH